ncbi:MAG: carboxypeptidase regulatory-like domain-containing protein [Bryobacterales bacterium]|nr:carboxypeptidase regulatory-like domain-containing protein [Bryobacterales bacterium]
MFFHSAIRRALLVFTALTLVVLSLSGQSTTQSVLGLVSDSSGAVIPNAKITLTNTGTGIVQTATTNETGNYTFTLVPVGNYDVRVEADGFKTELVRNLRVETAAQVRQDINLTIGNVAESIEVAANAVLLNTENAVLGAVVENRRIIELPLNGRNVQSLAVLVPGVQYGIRTGTADGSGGFPIPGQGFGVISNGIRETHQVFSLDGVDAKDPRIHIANFVPSIEAIEEFKIQTNAYSAEYGFGGGAQVTVTMKSGTNNLHGTLFNFLRNDAFDAENYFLNFELAPGATRAKKNSLRQNQYGLVLSGPVLIPKLYNGKNKTFWAFNYEARRTREGVVQTAAFPIDAFRTGDFSALARGYTANNRFVNPILIYDPETGTPFPNNIIPASRLHPGARNVLDKYVPRAQFVQQDIQDFTARAAVSQPINVNTYFARVDHNFNENNRVFARLAWDRSNLNRNNINPNLPVTVTSSVTNLATQFIHTFTPTTIMELRAGFNISDDLTRNPRTDDTSFDQDALGVGQFRIPGDGNRKLTPREHGIPQFTGLPFTLQELTNGNGYDQMDTIQPSGHFTMIRGTHNIKTGFEFYRVSMERGAANLEEGRLTFNNQTCGYAFACFLMGRPFSTETPEGIPLTFPRANRWGGYVQDDWKVTSRLTVNLGLRVDYNGWGVDADGRWRTFDIPGLGTDIGRGAGYRTPDGRTIPTIFPGELGAAGAKKLMQQQFRFFMPRIGIAFRPTDKTVIRVGAGWFDNIQHLNTFTIFNLMPPKAGSQLYQTAMTAAQTIPVTAANGNVVNVNTLRYAATSPQLTLDDPFQTRSTGGSVVRATNVTYAPPDYKDGSVWKWSFDIQRELPWGLAGSIGYAGSKSTNVGNSVGNWNDPVAPVPGGVFNQSLRPYPNFFDPAAPNLGIQSTGNIRYIDSFGEAFYHGMQVKLDKRTRSGLSMGIAYTLSKTHGDGDSGGQEGVAFQNPRDRRGSRGLVSFDQQHRMVSNFVWELPGANWKGIQGAALGGWQINGILTFASGFPFSVTQAAGDLGLPAGAVRPDLIGEAQLDNPTRARWFNTQAYQRVTCQVASRPDLCHLGSAGVNQLRAPGQQNLDFSAYKNFRFKERFNVQFRWEAFNFTNTPYFGAPGGISFSNLNQIIPNGTRDGEIRAIRAPMRRMQFGLKFRF